MTETRTPERAAADPQRADAGWMGRSAAAFTTPAGLLAVLLIAVQAVWRGGALMGGYFTQDDFVLMARADASPLTLDHLLEPYAGEVSPIGNLLVWATTRFAPMDWGMAALLVLALQTLAAVLLWLVLSRILPDRWVRLPLMAVACFAPLTLPATLTWSLALMYLPAVILFLGAALALLARIQDAWEPGPAVAGAALLLGLLASSHTLLLPFGAFVVVAAMLPVGEEAPERAGGLLERLIETVRVYPRLWAILLAAVIARILLGVSLSGGAFGWPSDGTAGAVIEQYVRQGLTGLVGGPWSGNVLGTVLVPDQNWPLGVAAIVSLLLAVPLVRAVDPVARLAVVGLATYFLGGAILLVLTQGGVGALGTSARFLADLVPVAVVLCALALRKTLVPPEMAPVVRRSPAAVAVALTLCYLVSAGITASELTPALKNSDDRQWVDYVRQGLDADPRVVLLDGPVPEGVMTGLFGGAAKVSTVTALVPESPAFDVPSEFLRIVDGLGLVRAIDLLEPVSASKPPPGDCGYAIDARPTRIRMRQPVPDGRQVMRLTYFLSGGTFALLDLPQGLERVPVQDGVHVVDVPISQGFSQFTISLESLDQTLCVARVEVGSPIPAPLPAQ